MAGLWLLGMHDKPLAPSLTVNKIVVEKSKRRLSLYSGETLLKTYPISLGKYPLGHKAFEGDQRTPEGKYVIHDKNPHSGYYKNLGISYPNKRDIAHAKEIGKNTPAQRLDSRLHRLDKRRGGRALSSRTDRNPDRD